MATDKGFDATLFRQIAAYEVATDSKTGKVSKIGYTVNCPFSWLNAIWEENELYRSFIHEKALGKFVSSAPSVSAASVIQSGLLRAEPVGDWQPLKGTRAEWHGHLQRNVNLFYAALVQTIHAYREHIDGTAQPRKAQSEIERGERRKEFLDSILSDKGWSIDGLLENSVRLEMDRKTLFNWKSGKTRNLTSRNRRQLAEALGVDVSELPAY